MTPSGVPPIPTATSTPVSSRAAMMAPATSPSSRNLIRAPVARTRPTSSSSWRGRSRMQTVSSVTSEPLALAMRRRFSSIGASKSTTAAASRADGQLLHVDARPRVEHGAPLGQGDHRDRVGEALGGQGGPVDRVDGDVDLGRAAAADPLAVVEHGGVVLLALADHHHPVHGDLAEHRAHGVDRRLVDRLLVAAAQVPGPSDGRGLGRANQLESEVAVGVGPGVSLIGHGVPPGDGAMLWYRIGPGLSRRPTPVPRGRRPGRPVSPGAGRRPGRGRPARGRRRGCRGGWPRRGRGPCGPPRGPRPGRRGWTWRAGAGCR